VDRWSAGTCEQSILNAYVDVIEKSEHYVYIEVVWEPGVALCCSRASAGRDGTERGGPLLGYRDIPPK
jgi:hypothetical protein